MFASVIGVNVLVVNKCCVWVVLMLLVFVVCSSGIIVVFHVDGIASTKLATVDGNESVWYEFCRLRHDCCCMDIADFVLFVCCVFVYHV